MRFDLPILKRWPNAAGCAAVTVLLGLSCLAFPPVLEWLDRLSYDLPFLFAPAAAADDLVIITRDEKSYRALGQDYGKREWNRALYARLLDHLTADQARLAVFDIVLNDPGDAAANAVLARAIRKNGHVILGVDYHYYEGVVGGEPIYPLDEFKTNAAGLGLALVNCDEGPGGRIVRELHPGDERHPTLAWAAAAHVERGRFDSAARLGIRRWLNYPGSPGQFHQLSFSDALDQAPGYFANKSVFVGGSPQIKNEGEQADRFATPLTRWGGGEQPGVVIQAMEFLNLTQGTWLTRLPPLVQALSVILWGLLAGFGFTKPGLRMAVAIAAGAAGLLFASACVLVFEAHCWFCWMIPAAAQTPFALGFCLLARVRRLGRERAELAGQLAIERETVERLLPHPDARATIIEPPPRSADGSSVRDAASSALEAKPASIGGTWLPPSVPDHSLVRCIGEGAYGQVWLARDAIASYHAVKFVYRRTFANVSPFEREFHGIQHFTPISRMHPGLVHILHVGRNESGGYFYYVMELGDDENSGQTIQPETYVPKTLSGLIRKLGRLPPPDCIQVGLELCSALEFLHERRLIHRDIKPSNVIYVHGHAKFADVGLVTVIDSRASGTSYVGTEGYIAPEGPGTAAADVYSLGKVLYEAGMGLDRTRFPDLPTSLVDHADPLLRQLNDIIVKACEFNPRDRYKSARELREDLQALAPK